MPEVLTSPFGAPDTLKKSDRFENTRINIPIPNHEFNPDNGNVPRQQPGESETEKQFNAEKSNETAPDSVNTEVIPEQLERQPASDFSNENAKRIEKLPGSIREHLYRLYEKHGTPQRLEIVQSDKLFERHQSESAKMLAEEQNLHTRIEKLQKEWDEQDRIVKLVQEKFPDKVLQLKYRDERRVSKLRQERDIVMARLDFHNREKQAFDAKSKESAKIAAERIDSRLRPIEQHIAELKKQRDVAARALSKVRQEESGLKESLGSLKDRLQMFHWKDNETIRLKMDAVSGRLRTLATENAKLQAPVDALDLDIEKYSERAKYWRDEREQFTNVISRKVQSVRRERNYDGHKKGAPYTSADQGQAVIADIENTAAGEPVDANTDKQPLVEEFFQGVEEEHLQESESGDKKPTDVDINIEAMPEIEYSMQPQSLKELVKAWNGYVFSMGQADLGVNLGFMQKKAAEIGIKPDKVKLKDFVKIFNSTYNGKNWQEPMRNFIKFTTRSSI